jgi:hypothetical protein
VEKGIDSVYYMGMLEDREDLTWAYLLPGWEPQSAVGMGSEPPNHVGEPSVGDTGSLARDVKESGE